MPSKIHVFRIKPDKELIAEIYRYCKEQNISSGIIAGIIGSLKNATLNYIVRLPGKYEGVDYNDPLELVYAQFSNQSGC